MPSLGAGRGRGLPAAAVLPLPLPAGLKEAGRRGELKPSPGERAGVGLSWACVASYLAARANRARETAFTRVNAFRRSEMSRECLPPEAEGKAGGTGRGIPFILGNTGNAWTEGRRLSFPYSPTETSLSFVWRKALCKDQKAQKKVLVKLSALHTTRWVPCALHFTHWENTLTHPRCSPPFPPLDILLFCDSLGLLWFCVSVLPLHSFQTYDAFLYTFFPKAT